MADTAIEWATKTWNPTTGCDKVSPGCDNCYALTMAKRLKGMGSAKYQRDGDPRTSGPGFGVSVHADTLTDPLGWRQPERIFVNSMSDLFHAEVPDEYIARVWGVMAWSPHHTYQILTKRHARMRSLVSSPAFRSLVDDAWYEFGRQVDHHPGDILHPYDRWPLLNVWLGVSTEDQQWANIRIPALLDTPAAVRFISAEPLLGPIDLLGQGGNRRGAGVYALPDPPDRDGGDPVCQDHGVEQCGHCRFLDWVIVGGESGRGARPMHPKWARSLRDQCTAADVPFLFKQHGAWAPALWHGAEGATHAFTGGLYQDDSGAWVENFMELGHNPMSVERDLDTPPGAQGMRRLGKKAAGRELDGRTWDQYPEVANA